MKRKPTDNPKRRINPEPKPEELERLAGMVRYGGNPEHKRNPGDFGLTPPACATRFKTLCDDASVFTRQTAEALLREGIRRGLISEQTRNGFPQNVWAVAANGTLLEAQLENAQTGAYHGYPMREGDWLIRGVQARWNREAYGKPL